jgi:hypothetical protein
MAADWRTADKPRVTFSLAAVGFVIAVICVLLAQYQAWGREAVTAWWFTLLLVGAFVLHRWKEWLFRNAVIVLFVVSGVWHLLSPPDRSRGGESSYCLNSLKQLAIATHSYSDRQGNLPPQNLLDASGQPALSWRVSLLPFLDHDLEYRKFDLAQSWNSPANRALADIEIREFRCITELNQRGSETSYVAITGDDTCWPATGPIKLEEIPDGASNTILFAETHDSGILWPEPRDLEYDKLDWQIHGTPGNSISSSHGPVIEYFDGSRKLKRRTRVHVALADGSVSRLSPDVDPEVLRQMANRRDGQPKELP